MAIKGKVDRDSFLIRTGDWINFMYWIEGSSREQDKAEVTNG